MFKSQGNKTRRLTKTKLMVAGALLFAFGVATSAVATSAWYSLYETATIGDLNLQINLKNDAWLELHLLNNGEDYYHEDGKGFTKEELGIEDKLLGEVSGMFQDDWYNESTKNDPDLLPKMHSRYRPGYNKTNPGYADRNEHHSFYVMNEFYFLSGVDTEIYLNQTSKIAANVEANKATAEKKGYDADRAMALNDVVHAVRISILTDEGYIIIDPGESNPTYYGGILDLNKDGYYDFDDGKEILYGEYSGDISYLPGEEHETEPLDNNRNTFIANHKQGVQKVDIENPNLTIKKEAAQKIDSLRYDFENDPANFKDVPSICHVKAGERKRMIVCVYVEGWDLHMTDDIASASFDVDISFTGLMKKSSN